MLQPNEELSIQLTAGEWDQVLLMLGKFPYENVSTLIDKIRNQGLAHHQQVNGAVEDAAHVSH